MIVPTPRRHLATAAMTASTSQLINEIADFRDFEYSVEAAAKNRAKMSVVDWVDANVSAELQPYQRSVVDALIVTVNMKTTPEPTEAEMVSMVENLRASPVAPKWLSMQKLAQAMSFDPIGDHVREHRPRGRFDYAISDKVHAAFKHGGANTRLRDYCDLFVFMTKCSIDDDLLRAAFDRSWPLYGAEVRDSISEIGGCSDEWAGEREAAWSALKKKSLWAVPTPSLAEVCGLIRSRLQPVLAAGPLLSPGA